ncbi:MAG: hypothetical protein H6841_08740 [Planctomycetes bacterium]|nr:hypothetical protein [Planctomycetota bacterium]MCB9934847.1 hypothetical protein [Planctomycetota bacterium]
MQRAFWFIAGCFVLLLGYFLGLGPDAVDASGTAIDPMNRDIVTSSPDGRQVYVWHDETRFGGEKAILRYYTFAEDGAYVEEFEIQAGDSKLRELQSRLDAAEAAMKALEEIGEKDSDDYKSLAEQRAEIAKEIAAHLAKKYPDED